MSGDLALLDRLEDVREGARGWMARCPAHEDRSASLSIGLGHDDRVLLHCFAGCSAADVLAAGGLEWGDLFPDGPRSPIGERSARRVPPVQRKPKAAPRPADVILSGFLAAGIEYRCIEGPEDMWTLACPHCDAPGAWLWGPYFADPEWVGKADDPEPSPAPVFSCPDGCSREQILAAIETAAALAELGVAR